MQIVKTHINVYYRDLDIAKREAAVANQKVEIIEEHIKGMGGELPEDGHIIPLAVKEDTAYSDDVSAAEKNPKKKGAKK